MLRHADVLMAMLMVIFFLSPTRMYVSTCMYVYEGAVVAPVCMYMRKLERTAVRTKVHTCRCYNSSLIYIHAGAHIHTCSINALLRLS